MSCLRLRFALAALFLFTFWSGVGLSQTPNAPKPTTESADVHLGKGYNALKQDRFDIAAAEFRAALEIDPTLTLRARFPLAVALFESHQTAEARKEFETVRHEAGDHENVLYYLGRIDLEERDFDSAIRNLVKAVAKPPFPDTAYYLGFAYFKQGDLASAEKWLKNAMTATPNDARVSYQLGQVYRKEGRDEEARKLLTQSSDQRSRDAVESQLRAECAQKLDRGPRAEARQFCDQLYDPDSAEKLTALGTVYGQHGDPEAALKPLRRAAELSPQSPQMQYNLAMAYYQLNQLEDAKRVLVDPVSRWPDIFELNALYGTVLAKLGEDVAAYQTLHHAHDLNREDASVADLLFLSILKLGYKMGEAGRYAESLRYFEEAAKMRPQEPEPHRGIAAVYDQTGRHQEAIAEQARAERLSKAGSAN